MTLEVLATPHPYNLAVWKKDFNWREMKLTGIIYIRWARTLKKLLNNPATDGGFYTIELIVARAKKKSKKVSFKNYLSRPPIQLLHMHSSKCSSFS